MGGTVGARTRQLAVGVQVEGDAATSRRGHEPEWKRGILEVRRFWWSGGPQMDKMNQFDQWNHSSDRSFFQYTHHARAQTSDQIRRLTKFDGGAHVTKK